MLVYHGERDDVLHYERVKPSYEKELKPLPNFKFKLIKGLGHSVIEEQLS